MAISQDRDAREMCERLIVELRRQETQAESVLRSLEGAKAETEAVLESANRTDPLKTVTGRSALDSAIEHTRAMRDRVRDAIREAGALLASSEPVPMERAVELRSVALTG